MFPDFFKLHLPLTSSSLLITENDETPGHHFQKISKNQGEKEQNQSFIFQENNYAQLFLFLLLYNANFGGESIFFPSQNIDTHKDIHLPVPRIMDINIA